MAPSPPTTTTKPITVATSTPSPPKSDTALQATTTECPPNNTLPTSTNKNINSNNLLRKLASSHYQSYTTALTVTIAVGCFLLLLNVLIFAGIYHQRDRGKSKKKKQKELLETGSCSSSSGENYDKQTAYEAHQMGYESCKSYELSRGNSFECKTMPNFIGEYSCEKRSLADVQMTEISLQDFKCSPPPGTKRCEDNSNFPPDVTSTGNQQDHNTTSPTIPEPPPPPKNQPPNVCNQSGILRSQNIPTTPGTMKKRVQIQEISV